MRRATLAAAARTGVEVVDAATASASHHACAAEPWVTKFVYGGFLSGNTPQPYHPNLAGMTAVARLVAKTWSCAPRTAC